MSSRVETHARRDVLRHDMPSSSQLRRHLQQTASFPRKGQALFRARARLIIRHAQFQDVAPRATFRKHSVCSSIRECARVAIIWDSCTTYVFTFSYGCACGVPHQVFFAAVVEKEIELACGVCWPCSCERDWAPSCPSGESFCQDRV